MFYAILVPTALAVVVGLSGCSIKGKATVGYPAIFREAGRADNGEIEQIKASPDKKTAYWENQTNLDKLLGLAGISSKEASE